jgi:hypothetical protein
MPASRRVSPSERFRCDPRHQRRGPPGASQRLGPRLSRPLTAWLAAAEILSRVVDWPWRSRDGLRSSRVQQEGQAACLIKPASCWRKSDSCSSFSREYGWWRRRYPPSASPPRGRSSRGPPWRSQACFSSSPRAGVTSVENDIQEDCPCSAHGKVACGCADHRIDSGRSGMLRINGYVGKGPPLVADRQARPGRSLPSPRRSCATLGARVASLLGALSGSFRSSRTR